MRMGTMRALESMRLKMARGRKFPSDTTPIDTVDTHYLETLLGYNARRAALVVIARFVEHMAEFDLSTVEFSVLSLIRHNPGITSSQLCQTLGIQAPNLVKMIAKLSKRTWIKRAPHPTDGRAIGLHLTPTGEAVMSQTEPEVAELEGQALTRLTAAEHRKLLHLLQKIYKPGAVLL